MVNSEITNEKTQLRKILISKRQNMKKDKKIMADKQIFHSLINDRDILGADLILTYVSTDIEVDTRKFIDWCIEQGKTVATPISGENTLTFSIIKNISDLVKGKFSILEPKACCEKVSVSKFHKAACIVPALQFNEQRYRIGYGRGYYDRFLEQFKGISIGICYSEFIGAVPVDIYDKNVDKVITD